MTVATTILRQLVGRKFMAMTGAHSPRGDEKSLTMTLRRNASKAKWLRITLTSMDDYYVEFLKMSKGNVVTVREFHGVYADQLAPIFEEVTGMYTKLF